MHISDEDMGRVRIDETAGRSAAVEPGFDRIPQRTLCVGSNLVHDHGLVGRTLGLGKEGASNARVGFSLLVGGLDGRDILGFHLQSAIRVGRATIQQLAG